MDAKVKRWAKVMEIARKLWGCHQKPERSFFCCGYQFPLCARCTGIFVGYVLAVMMVLCGCVLSPFTCLCLVIPLVFDGTAQLLLVILSNNSRRFVTGLLFGAGTIHLLVNVLMSIIA